MVAALAFQAFWCLEIETGDLMVPDGDPKTEKGPHGDPGPQMGTHLGAVLPHTNTDCHRRPQTAPVLSEMLKSKGLNEIHHIYVPMM